MMRLQNFVEMGGYGVYIWPAFAVTTIIMVGLLMMSLYQLRIAERTLEMLRTSKRKLKGEMKSSGSSNSKVENGS